MKVLFCSRVPLSRSLGATKVVIELAEALRPHGVTCEVHGREDIVGSSDTSFKIALRGHLIKHAANFDVVDFDHEDLPFARTDFPPQVLMVARSVLLAHHFELIRLPDRPGLKYCIRRLFLDGKDRGGFKRRAAAARLTTAAADLVNVANYRDRDALIAAGIAVDRIVVIPYGLSATRRQLFNNIPAGVPTGPPMIAFVGSFDYRKGAREMPALWECVRTALPEARLRLLGTAGLMQTEHQVRRCFTDAANRSIEIYPRFEPDMLPSLLAPCWAGIFPSWIEGFGIGVLEMLAAGVPVCAYDSPGPPEMLKAEDLVPRGDYVAMANRVITWLKNRELLAAARVAARRRSEDFDWGRIAARTAEVYSAALSILQSKAASVEG